MLRNALFSLLILIVGKSYAQQDYFVLIQADNSQPFYVKLYNKTLSSNAKGRLILSQLKGGDHIITVGFPKQMFPEQQFSFHIGEKDLEFQLKDLGEKGWGLFNPQTLELRPAEKKEVTAGPNSEGVKKDDAFSRLMAGVVSDTAVMYNTYTMEEALKDSPVVKGPVQKDSGINTMVKADTAATIASTPVSSPVDSVKATHAAAGVVGSTPHVTTPRPISTVVKLSERKTVKGLRLAFADRPKGRKADTIIVIIPIDSSPVRQVALVQPDSATVAPATAGTTPQNKPDSIGTITRTGSGQTNAPGELYRPKSDAPATVSKTDTGSNLPNQTIVRNNPDTIHVYLGPADTTRATTGKVARSKPDSAHNGSASARVASPAKGELFRSKPDSSQKGSGSKPVVVNSDCHNFASDYDVDKLRVKMLEISKDDERIQTAKKIFKTKCFTTRQIKALSEVFTSDAGKYRFFEAAYPFVSDDRFRELTDLLADPVYNGKFRTMTGQ